MDQRPVSAAPQKGPPSWRLAAPHDKLTQGMVVSGFATLPTGRALFLQFCWKGVTGMIAARSGGEEAMANKWRRHVPRASQ